MHGVTSWSMCAAVPAECLVGGGLPPVPWCLPWCAGLRCRGPRTWRSWAGTLRQWDEFPHRNAGGARAMSQQPQTSAVGWHEACWRSRRLTNGRAR